MLPASMMTVESARGSRSTRGGGDALLLLDPRDVAVGQAGLDQGERVGGYGAAVHAADQVAVLEDRQVAAYGLGGDVVLLGELDHGDAPALAHELGHRLLALRCIHGLLRDDVGTRAMWVSICVYVVLRPNVLTVKQARS